MILACACLSLYMLLSIDLFSSLARKAGWPRFITTFLFFYTQIISTEFLLGLFSVLNGYSLVLLNVAVSTCLVIVLRKKFGKKIIINYLAKSRQSLASLKRLPRKDPLWSILLFLAIGFIGWIIFLGILFPATDFDGNSYHLAFVGNVIQNHSFADVPTSLPWLIGYPKGGEFIQMWSVIISHNDMLTDLTQLPFLVLGVYALYEIGLRLGADKKQARFSATLFVFLPIVLNQLKTTYVDVMLSALFFAAMAVIIQKRLRKIDWVLLGILFSLIISVKSTGFLFVLVLSPLLSWQLYKNFGKHPKSYLQPLLLILLPTSFGLYWYVKNFILYRSPIYPFGFKLAGISIFPGKTFQEFAADAVQSTSLPNGCAQRIWFVWTEQKDWFGCFYNYDTNYAGLGPIWFIILIPAVLISIYFAIKKRNALYFAVTATIVGLFAIYPSNYYSRYTLFITAVGIFALSIVLTNLRKDVSRLVKGLALVLAVSVIATNFVLCNFPPLVVKAQFKSVVAGSERGEVYSNMPGKAFVFLEDKVQPGQVVDYDSSPYFIYPLWKPDFSNKVIYIPASNEESWYKELDNKHVVYVFTTLNSKENHWAESKLKGIYKDDTYEIFKVSEK